MADVKIGERITITAVVESAGHDDRHVIVRIGGRPVQVPVPMTTTTTQALLVAVLAIACPRCGAGQDEQCISRTGRRYTASESHTARVDAARLARRLSGDLPETTPSDRWTALREEIRLYRDIHNERASDLIDEGKGGANLAHARADELGKVLDAMDRLEGDR